MTRQASTFALDLNNEDVVSQDKRGVYIAVDA
jgi:hypothetical protein